jgi:hypothetical protein
MTNGYPFNGQVITVGTVASSYTIQSPIINWKTLCKKHTNNRSVHKRHIEVNNKALFSQNGLTVTIKM